MLPQIAISFDQLLKAHRGIVPITILSAVALNDTTRNLIVSKIQHSSTEKLEVEEIIDPSLIGGFIVRMDDKQIDASVASQINNLKQRLTR
jgi:F-type H+-transporting ATPase subunit delta